MAVNVTELYQLGHDGDLVFERDLTALAIHLGRPFPEFMGGRLYDHPEGELQWLVVASVRGKMGDPTSTLIQFEIMENNWVDGLAKGMQEMLVGLCGHHVEEIQGLRFQHYARCDHARCPMEMPPLHHELRHHVDHLYFMMYSTQQEADYARTKANLDHFVLLEVRGTIRLLAREHRCLHRQRRERDDTIEELKAKVAEMTEYLSDLETHHKEAEEEGIDLRKERDALLSDDEDYMEDMDMEDQEDDDDDGFIDDEEVDAPVVDLDDDESEVPDV
jgi:hypothetical protein